MMKRLISYMLLVASAMMSLQASAATEQQDTLYLFFFSSWKQIIDLQPEAVLADPIIEAYTPYEVYISSGDDATDDIIKNKFIAFALNDTILYLSSDYIKKDFGGDAKHLNGYVPLYYNEKTAFVIAPAPLTVKDILFGNDEDGYTFRSADYYYIDFSNRRVERVTHSCLSKLLEPYHDLQMRYEGMKDYKKSEIIEDYFFKFLDRYTEDFMTPAIVDLVSSP